MTEKFKMPIFSNRSSLTGSFPYMQETSKALKRPKLLQCPQSHGAD